MKLPPVLSILWARWPIFLIPVAGALIGSSIAMAVTPPQYQSAARVVLNYIKPEADTGLFVTSKMAESYEKTQIDFLREPEVAGLAAEALGWLDAPEMQEAYAMRDPRDTRDMASWIAGRMVANISGTMVEDSNILEIRYNAPTPAMAKTVVGALRDAYIQASTLQFRRSADEKANANAARLEQVRKRLAELESQKTRFEQATGMILDERNRDFDALRLQRMVAMTRTPKAVVTPMTTRDSATMNSVAAVDAALASGAQALGPNNPQYQALLRRRNELKVAADALSGRGNALTSFFEQQQRAEAALFDSLKAKVISQRDQILQLKLLQDQIAQQRAVATQLSQNTAEQRELSSGQQTGLVPIGDPTEGKKSIRSNGPLITLVATGIGALYGTFLCLLVEFLARQVRTPASLEVATGAPVIGVIPRSRHKPDTRRRRVRVKGFAWPSRKAAARA